MISKTVEEVKSLEILKRDWLSDPCWDIETTDGFEKFYDELLEYRLQVEEEEKEKAYIKQEAWIHEQKCTYNDIWEYLYDLKCKSDWRMERHEESNLHLE